jgi:prevent-host-death family protein
MPQIRPVSDLRNNFAEISRIVHEKREPVFLTKNGFGDMVVMSVEMYEDRQYDTEVDYKLKKAEAQAKSTAKRYSHTEVIQGIRQRIADAE